MKKILTIEKIHNILPHRYPFLLVDFVFEMKENSYIKCVKNVTINEPFFQGHFPQIRIMPGVLIIEALAQAGAILLLSEEKYAGKIVLLTGVDNFKFKRPVTPGDTLILEVLLKTFKLNIGKAEVCAKVEDKIVASGEISFAIANNDNKTE